LLSALGPESARQQYSLTVQLYERILSMDTDNTEIRNELNRFKETYNRESAIPGSTDKPLTIVSVDIDNIFPSLMQYYMQNPVGRITVKNELDKSVENLRAEISLRQFIDFPLESIVIDSLAPGEQITIDLKIMLNEKAFNIQEDLPVLTQVNVLYDTNGIERTVSKTSGTTLYRRTALSWDNTAKLAAFIMPNEGIVSTFSHRALEDNLESGGLPSKMVKAARICDALGTYGINYVEDPNSPLSGILGKEEHVDTVRYPRTTLHIRSGDCDDTTALLASLLESSGIHTAIMTSPGHVFLAFNSEEPTTNSWMFETEGLKTIEHNGTLWIPVESTILSEGFLTSWKEASKIINKYRPDEIEFVPVEDERDLFPPLPLAESNLVVIEPGSEQIDYLFNRSLEGLTDELYRSSVSAIESVIADADNRRNRQNKNKLGILHARFEEYSKAERIFRNLIREYKDYLSPYLNLGNLFYYMGNYSEAREILERGIDIRPESTILNLALAKTFYHLDDPENTLKYFRIVKSQSEELSDQFAYLISTEGSARAGINDEPPMIWDVED